MKHLFRHREYYTILFAFVLFFVSPYLLRWMDPTAGVYDAGILQNILVAVIAFLVFQTVVWFSIKLIWPSVRTFFEEEFELVWWHQLTKQQRLCAGLAVYFLLFFLLVLLYMAL